MLLSDPIISLSATSVVPLPLEWLMNYLPFFKVFRVPSRLGLLAVIGIALVATFALSHVRHRLANQGYRKGWPAVALAMVFLMAEYAVWPYPARPIPVSPFYRQLAAQGEPFGIIPVPLTPHAPGMAIHEYFQTIHHKPIVAAYTSRPPRHSLRFFNRNKLLLFLHGQSKDKPLLGPRHYNNVELQAGLSSLHARNLRYIVIHKKHLHRTNLAAIESGLQRLKLPCVWNDNELLAYQITLHE